MANVKDLAAKVAQLLPSVPQPAIEDAVREAYFTFCSESRAWTAPILDTKTTPESQYLFFGSFAPGHARIYDIDVFYLDGRLLDWGDLHRARQQRANSPGRPRFYELRMDGNVILRPTPDNEYEVEGELILVPRKTSDVVDDGIYDNFEFALKHGAVYVLTSAMNKPWTDPNQAQESVVHFSKGISDFQNLAGGQKSKKNRRMAYGGL